MDSSHLKKTDVFVNSQDTQSLIRTQEWKTFLNTQNFDFSIIQKIDMSSEFPVIFDLAGNKFSVNFRDNRLNYHKKKSSIKNELISRALGAGRLGLRVLDLSAGLGIDSVFLAQLGYQVTAIERNALIYLALNEANKLNSFENKGLGLEFIFSEAKEYLVQSKLNFDVIYFDPMFPDKAKSALPRQEMVLFKNLVGRDEDASEVLELSLSAKGVKRVVVKRPIRAPALLRPQSSIEGKLIRFDIYGVKA